MLVSPGQQVLSTAELIDQIFSYLDIKTVLRARVVCRKWRSVSDLYLKRRMSIRNWNNRHRGSAETLTVAIYPEVQNATNLLNNTFRMTPSCSQKLTLTTWDSKGSKRDSGRGPKWRHSSAPFIAIVLGQDWTSTIDTLKLHLCLTVNDLLACQLPILKSFKSARSVFVKLLRTRISEVPLCYAELQNQGGQDVFQNVNLKRFEVRGWLRSFKRKKAKSLDSLVYNLFATCPNVDTFKLGLFQICDDDDKYNAFENGANDVDPDDFFRSDMWAEGDSIETDLDFTITRSSSPNRVRDAIEVQPYWTARLIICHRDLGPALSSLMATILGLTQLQKLWISLKYSVLEKVVRKTKWLQDRLDVLYLTSGYHCPVVLKALDSTTVFTNVTRLYWTIALDFDTFRLNFAVGDRPTFPNVVMLQLHRPRTNMYREPKEGFEPDIWISRYMHKMAPNVRRLIVDVFNGERGEIRTSLTMSRLYVSPQDIPRMLDVAKSFRNLEDLVLINPDNYGEKWTDLDPVCAAACLKGLKSLTLSIQGHKILMEAAKYFLKVCKQESLESITKLGLYNRWEEEDDDREDYDSDEDYDEDAVFAELRRSGVSIPDHLIVTSGIWTKEMAKAAFENLVI